MSDNSRPARLPARRLLWRAGALTVAFVGAAVTIAGATAWHGALVRSDHSVVNDEGAAAASSVASTLKRYDDLVALSAEGVGSGALDAREFHELMQRINLAARYPGINGIGFIAWSPEVPGAAVPTIADRCPGTVEEWAEGASPQPLVGYDFCTVPWLRRALMASADTARETVISEKTLGKGYAADFVLLTPHYRSPSDEAGSRLASLTGWGAALVNGKRLLTTVVSDAHRHVGVQLFSALAPSPMTLTAQVRAPNAPIVGSAVEVLGRNPPWALRTSVVATTPSLRDVWLAPLLCLLAGLWFAASLGALVLALVRSRETALDRAHRSEQVSREETVRFNSLAGASPVGILEVTGRLGITYVNQRLAAIAGRSAAELMGTLWLDYVHAEDRMPFLAKARRSAQRRGTLDATVRMLRASGEVRTIRIRTAGLYFDEDDARADRYVATVEDVTDELVMQEQLRHQALHDALTGLPNRTVFTSRLEEALQLARRGPGGPAVLFFDIDRFKVVNDGLGHDAGDALLQALADRLGALARAGETLARMGGDEFALLLSRVDSVEAAAAVSKRLLRALDEPFHIAGRDLVTSISIGVAVAGDGEDPAVVLRNADAAMYRAKDEGRGRFVVFHDALYDRSLQRLQLEGELREALDRGEFLVHYQPIVELPSEIVVGAEALVRWRHPTRGLLAPNAFIALAEETGLVVPLGQWVFKEALTQLRAWDDEEGMPRLATMAVNYSARQLRDAELSDTRRRVIGDLGLDDSRLSVEITESLAMEDNPVTRQLLSTMTAHGVQVAIDDFGTGYSSLAYLQQLPVKVLKIDKRFVDGVGIEEDSDAIVSAVIEMAHQLGLRLVAEGVELPIQRDHLVRLGCDAAQGFLWSRPVPAAEFSQWCRAHAASAVVGSTA